MESKSIPTKNAFNRLNLIRSQLLSNKTFNSGKYQQKSADDVVIVAAVRTPLGKAGKGSFKDTMPEVLTKTVIAECLNRTKVDPSLVQEVVFGNVLQSGACFMPVRMSQFLAGLPDTTTFMTVNRLCSSGLQAVMNLNYAIQSKQIDCGIAGGVECMSLSDMNSGIDPEKISEEIFDHEQARNCMVPMGITSENVVEKFNISRQTQDQFAVDSHRKAYNAQVNGYFNEEIVPVKTKVKGKDGELKEIIVSKDEGIRGDTTLEGLSKLKASFKKGGSTTAGNSSQVTDGAAAVMLMRRSMAEKLGVPVLGRFIGYSVAGVPPEIMGIGPAYAIPAVLKKVGMELKDIDIFELNEAFASQASYCVEKLGIPIEKVNPKGGAIALGHPLGCTGARQVSTLLYELKRTNKRFGIISMCIGTGMGAAAVLEIE